MFACAGTFFGVKVFVNSAFLEGLLVCTPLQASKRAGGATVSTRAWGHISAGRPRPCANPTMEPAEHPWCSAGERPSSTRLGFIPAQRSPFLLARSVYAGHEHHGGLLCISNRAALVGAPCRHAQCRQRARGAEGRECPPPSSARAPDTRAGTRAQRGAGPTEEGADEVVHGALQARVPRSGSLAPHATNPGSFCSWARHSDEI